MNALTNTRASDAVQAWRAAKYAMPIDAHTGMAKALQQEPGHLFELAPFAAMMIEGETWIGCNSDPDGPDGDILLVHHTLSMRFLDGANGFYGQRATHDQPLNLYTNGLTFARDWAAARHETYVAAQGMDGFTGTLTGSIFPGIAAIGDLDGFKNFADISQAPQIRIDNPKLRHVLVDAMLRAAHLPPVTVMQPKLRIA